MGLFNKGIIGGYRERYSRGKNWLVVLRRTSGERVLAGPEDLRR